MAGRFDEWGDSVLIGEAASRVLPTHIQSWSRYCAGHVATGAGGGTVGGLTWVANLAMYMPMTLPFPYPVRRLWWANSTAGVNTTHVDVGIYSWVGGARIVSSGSTAQSAASVGQYVSLGTDIVLAPGNYWLAIACDTATANMLRGLQATTNTPGKMMGFVQQASAFPLPATMTAAAWTQTGWSLPYYGITWTASGF